MKNRVKIGDIFKYKDTGHVVCTICAEGKLEGEFSSGKKWEEWKLDYLKRHLSQKIHIDAITKLRNQKKCTIVRKLTKTPKEREIRVTQDERKRSDSDMVKVLIDNVILAIKINASMYSVQEIHAHVAKYANIPESWRSKNYAFEFVECISKVLHNQIMEQIKKSAFHTLIADKSTGISVQKMLILYIKFRPENDTSYKTIFAGILKLSACDSMTIVEAIKKFYVDNNLDIKKMVMFTSDGARVMLGKKNGVAAILRREIKHLCEQHCVAHREDLGMDDAWKMYQ